LTKQDDEAPKTPIPASRGARTQPYGPRSDSRPPAARSDPASSEPPPSEPEFDPYRFGRIEFPTELRLKLIGMELPSVPREDLCDTVPPNGASTASDGEQRGPESEPAARPVVVPVRSKSGPALIGVILAALLVIAAIAALRSPTPNQGARGTAKASLPAVQQRTASSSAVPAQAEPQIARPAPESAPVAPTAQQPTPTPISPPSHQATKSASNVAKPHATPQRPAIKDEEFSLDSPALPPPQ
jgi:hypothetical protein